MKYVIAFLLLVIAVGIYFFDRLGKLKHFFYFLFEKKRESGDAASIVQDLTIALKNREAMTQLKNSGTRIITKTVIPPPEMTTGQVVIPAVPRPAPIVETSSQIDPAQIPLKIEKVFVPEEIEQGMKMLAISFHIKNESDKEIKVNAVNVCFSYKGEDVSHQYIVRGDAGNVSVLAGGKDARLNLTVDVGHQTHSGKVDVLPDIWIQLPDFPDPISVPPTSIGQWTVHPKGRTFLISTEHQGMETAGTPFKIRLEANYKGRVDPNYQGTRRVYFTSSATGTIEYPSQIPNDLDLVFEKGVAQSENWFCFYNIIETPNIHAQDKSPGGAKGACSAITIRPAATGSLQLRLTSPQTSGYPIQGDNLLSVLDIYNNPKVDFDADVEVTAEGTAQIVGLSGLSGNIIKATSFSQGEVNLTSLGLIIEDENISEPITTKVCVSGEDKIGHSDDILIIPPSMVKASSEANRTARTVFRRLLTNRKKRIWVANCEEDISRMLVENFENDYDVKVVTLENTSINDLIDEKPDVLFLDAGNSNLDGYEILHRIKSTPEIEQLPVLFLGSPYEAENKILNVLRHGAAYVTKPLTIPTVKARVIELLDNIIIGQGKLPIRGARLQGSDGLIYRIIAKIGEGGMGYIYEAERLRDKKKVIIKYLPPTEYKDMKAVMRFIQEGLTVINFDHENLVQGYDLLMDRNRSFYVMELITGKTLEALIQEEYSLEPLKSLDIALQVARALEAISEQHHLVHRDIKPANILVVENGLVKVVDFGIAKVTDRHCSMTTRGIILGTPYYLSPEQILGKQVTIQSDIYSLGATFYHMVTGEVPFQGNDVLDIIHQRLSRDPRDPREINPGVPPAVAQIILKMMQRKPSRRHSSAEALIIELETLLERLRSGNFDVESTSAIDPKNE